MSSDNTIVRVCRHCNKPFFRPVGAVERHSVGVDYCNRQEYLEAVEPKPPSRSCGSPDPAADLFACIWLASEVLKQAYEEEDYPYLRSPLTAEFAALIHPSVVRWLQRVLPECTP